MRIWYTLLVVFLCTPLPGFTAQGREPSPRGSVPSPIEALTFTLRSQQSELRMVKEGLSNFEEQMDLVREDLKRALKDQEDQTSHALQRQTIHLQDNEQGLSELNSDYNALRRDLSALIDHVKELHTLVESLQGTLQNQVKKNNVLEKTLSTLIHSLDGSSSGASATAEGEHKVQAGETLEKIARKYGTTIRLLKEQNQLDTDRIRVGQTLKLPSPASAP